jgi:acyl-coenzyme A synthetase/AMP-(fatty) acid ligase
MPHKYPRSVIFVKDLPRTATGKIQRYKLREIAARGDQHGSATGLELQL